MEFHQVVTALTESGVGPHHLINPENFPYGDYLFMFEAIDCTFAVIANWTQEALDEAADSGMLRRYEVTTEHAEYMESGGLPVSYLGNYGVPYDIEYMRVTRHDNRGIKHVASRCAV
jgi:hypothetical protein